MTEKEKVTPEELWKTISEVKELAEKSKAEVEELIRKKPLESACFVFLVALVFGILIGTSATRR